MSQKPSTNDKDKQKAASPEAETEEQARIRQLEASLSRTEAAVAAYRAKRSAGSTPKPAPTSTPATGGLAINESGYYESGQWPPTDAKLHPPQQRQRLQQQVSSAKQKKPSDQGRAEGSSGTEKQKQLTPAQPKKPSTPGRVQGPSGKEKQQQVAKTERPATLGGHKVTSGAEEGLAGSKHAPGKPAPRQPPQPRGQGRGKRGGGQARGGAAVKKEEGEMRGHQIRGASQRARASMLPPSRPPPRQTSIPAPSPPQQQPCHMPYCQGTFGPGVRFCPLCGVSRQEPAASPSRQQPCHMPYCPGNFGPGVRFCPSCGTSRQEPQDHGTYGAPYQERRDSSPFLPYANSRLGAYGSPPQYASSPAPAVHLTINNAPSQLSSAPLESFPTRGSATPAPPATSPSRPLKRERSPSSSLQTEATISRGAKRRRRLAEERAAERAAARAASTVLPSIETPQPSLPPQTPQPSQQPASTDATTSPSVTEVPQQLPGGEPEKSDEKVEPADIESDGGENMEFAPAPSNDELAVPPPPQLSDVVDARARAQAHLAAQQDAFNRLENLGLLNSEWLAAARHELQNQTEARLAQVRSQVATVAQHHGFPPSNFDPLLRLHEEHHAEALSLIENCTRRRARPVNEAFTTIESASASQLEELCLSIEQHDNREVAEYMQARNLTGMRYRLRYTSSELAQFLEEIFRQCSAAPSSLPAPPSASLPAISQHPVPPMLPASSPPEPLTALIPRQDRAIVSVDESIHRFDELEDDEDEDNVRMEGAEDTSASLPTGNSNLALRRRGG